MGVILTSFGDDAYDHEGYAAHVLSDGSLTGTYSDATEARMIGRVVAACGCGWSGTTRYPTTTGPFDETALELALDEWEHQHARPTLERAQAVKWNQLRAVLVRLADSHRAAAGGGLSTDQQRDLLELTLDRLARATELAHQLGESLPPEGVA